MPRFRFRLEKLLGLRERAERDAAREMGALLSKRNLCFKQLEDFQRDRRALLTRRADLQRGIIRPTSLAQNRYQLIVLDRAIETWRDRVSAMDEDVARARKRLELKRRDKKLLEKLKEKRYSDFESQERMRERREQDAMPERRRGMAIAMSQRNPDRG